MNKVREVKQMDLYDEMASVCPNRDLKLMRTYSHEEVHQRITHYSARLAQAQDKHALSSTEDSDYEVLAVEEDMGMEPEPAAGERGSSGLRNIFE